MPKYEVYKDSQVQWIGDIPANWHLEKAKWLFYKADRKPLVDDDIVTCFRDGQVTLRKNRRTEGFTNALKEHGYQRICKGDLVIHAMDAFAGAIGVSDSDGKSTPVYAACVPRKKGKVNSYYYAYYMRDLALSGFIVSLAKGIRERSTDFRFNDFAELLLPFPDYEEQTRIANFLDKKTALIDEAIALKEQQISLLKERKQIIIQQAVTQGLDPNVPMKDSGVDWIGDIPAHWNLMSLRYAFEFLNSRRVPISAVERESRQGVYPYYGASGVIDYVDDYIFDEDLILIAEDGANLLSKSTPLAFVATGKYWVNNHAHIIKPKFHGFKYWAELLSGLDYTVFISGAAQPKLTRDRLASVLVPVPPKDEIQEIILFIEGIEPDLNRTIDIQKSQIEKLKEYKTTLINSAVTGKIKITPEMVEQ
ncbi:TPA: restriction endonuclease subunit S [Proteus mirabilis]|nr:restriction endonuclease subunit S [Proteus mirabilis]HCR4067377.1 restriction endonuclease subunit S [Proteus mirabilis]HDU8622356.1 restriction endonuclease subunit S [Proteus mirabilis]HEH1508384.1 restriction endonuclease subunit S [Proteus mirabilis]HEJ9450157.1 restriction endonuclease subunit S [Proteus mirabilis]